MLKLNLLVIQNSRLWEFPDLTNLTSTLIYFPCYCMCMEQNINKYCTIFQYNKKIKQIDNKKEIAMLTFENNSSAAYDYLVSQESGICPFQVFPN